MGEDNDQKGGAGIPIPGTATDASASAATATATLAAPGANYFWRIFGWSGGSNNRAGKLELKVDGTVRETLPFSSGQAGEQFNRDNAIDCPVNTAVVCLCTPDTTGQCSANVRAVLVRQNRAST